tara:strand:+ start:97 stop:525 length:429 start_codon:yes stop_codon:yes gene_type:complete
MGNKKTKKSVLADEVFGVKESVPSLYHMAMVATEVSDVHVTTAKSGSIEKKYAQQINKMYKAIVDGTLYSYYKNHIQQDIQIALTGLIAEMHRNEEYIPSELSEMVDKPFKSNDDFDTRVLLYMKYRPHINRLVKKYSRRGK